MDALKDLAEKVSAAVAQLEALHKQNRSLKTKVKKLEAELAEGSNGDGWREERAEIRERVVELTDGLEALL
jgi:cell division protein FtsB